MCIEHANIYFMENLKGLLVGVMSALAAYLSPISSVIFSIFYVFILNFIFGLLGGFSKGEKFDFKKAFSTIKEVLIYYLIILSVYLVGERMGDKGAALQAITSITYAFIYFYVVNILKNLCLVFKESRALFFIHYVVSFEIVKKIPFLESFVKNEGKEVSHEA